VSDRTCSVSGCEFVYLAKGFCNRHYLRWKKTGHPGEGGPIPQRECDICGQKFMPYREYQRACSKKCRERLPDRIEAQRLYDARPERRRQQNIARAVVVNPAQRQANLRQRLRRLYGLTVEQYEAMLAAQDGRCVICGDPPDPNGIKAASRLHVDHDHTTGRNRDLLCCRCNQGIGYFKDDPGLFRAAAAYIERHRVLPA
jgi:hypothetical protein